jgi:hypothetical protein
MMNKHNVRSVLLGLALSFASIFAHSALVSGELEFAGTVNNTAGNPLNATNFAKNKISFTTGDFTSLSIGTLFSMAGVNLGLVPAPASSSFTIGNFSVVLNTANVVDQSIDPLDPLDMAGLGTITDLLNQYEVTQIQWSFSETPFMPSKSLYTFKINTVSEVPVPAAGWMMFSALSSAGLLRLRRKMK